MAASESGGTDVLFHKGEGTKEGGTGKGGAAGGPPLCAPEGRRPLPITSGQSGGENPPVLEKLVVVQLPSTVGPEKTNPLFSNVKEKQRSAKKKVPTSVPGGQIRGSAERGEETLSPSEPCEG